MSETIAVENVNHPGQVGRVDARKYAAMKDAMLACLPKSSPGLTYAELKPAILGRLPEGLFPGGAKAGWWIKGVQLDLEAKGVVVRDTGSPLRFRLA